MKKHDAGSFEAQAVPLLDVLYRAARALTGNEHDARDLVQTTYLKAMERFETFRRGSSIKAWMMRIMRNTWIDRLRHRKVVGPEANVDDIALPARPEPAEPETDIENMLESFSDAQVISALAELPADQRMTLFLSDVESMSQDEIANVMDVAIGTVKSRVSRARRTLRDKLETHARDLGFLKRRT